MKPLAAKSLLSQDLATSIKKRSGYLPIQMLELAYHQGIIHAESSLLESQFQPGSLDLRLGEKAYRVQCSFLPETGTVESKLKDLTMYPVDLRDGGILERGAIYLIPLMEELELPSYLYGRTNPKSSIGRLDMFTRVITDYGHRFDEIVPGYKGKLYLEVIARSFPVRVCKGLTLNQLRLITKNPDISDKVLKNHYLKQPILFDASGKPLPLQEVFVDDGLYVGIDLSSKGREPIAFKAKSNSAVIDLSKVHYYDASDFWEPIYKQKKKRLILEPESFYIMMSKEKICIWPHLLAEMAAYEPNSGELRTHYAGFFDPGFGWHGGKSLKNQGTRAVMEVRPHDVPFLVEDGQTFCRLKFEKVIETPRKIYGKDIQSNYHAQKLTLSKFFKN
jgi:dCTP deaminase